MENTQKTPEQWFQKLKEPYRSQSIKNIDKNFHSYNANPNSMERALFFSFDWEKSPEYHDYWDNVYKSINAGETTYLEPETLKPEQMESGKWYVIKTSYEHLSKLNEVFEGDVSISQSYNLSALYNEGGGYLITSEIKSIRPATKEEVLKYFPDEVFEHEPTDWKAMYQELKAKYDQLEPKGEKVYFYFNEKTGHIGFNENLDVALKLSPQGNEIYQAVCIGKKKSVLVNENS